MRISRKTSGARRVLGSLPALLVLFLFQSTPAAAQDAELRGAVTDQSGAVVPGASVTLMLPTTGFRGTHTTDSVGHYVFSFLMPGTYNLTTELSGFETVTRTGIVLDVGAVAEFNIVISPARVSEAVEVTGAASPVDQTQGVGLVIDRDFLQNMPLNGRTLQSLIQMTPGVVADSFSAGQFSINGMRTTSNLLTIDGVSANVGVSRGSGFQNPLSFRVGPVGDTDTNASGANPAFNSLGGSNDIVQIESVEQFRVQTSAYSAQYGRQPGGQIQLVTRSGTNRFTGTGFEYFRNSALDANDWFSNANPALYKEPLDHHQFGSVLGGPIVQDKAFFFLSYEGLQMRQPQAVRQRHVPAASLHGDPRLSPLLGRLIDAYPMPQLPAAVDSRGNPTGAALFSDASTSRQRSNSYSIKLDRNFGSTLMLSGRWNQGLSGRSSYMLAQETASSSDVRTLTVNARSALGNRLMNELSANGSRNGSGTGSTLSDRYGVTPIELREFLPALAPASATASVSLPGITPADEYALGSRVANRQEQLNLVEQLSWDTRRHGFRFGADLRRLTPTYGRAEYRSVVSFNSLSSLVANQADLVSISSSDSLRLGVVSFSSYAQDTFRASSRVTLDVGLRWEVNPAPEGLDKPLYTLEGFPDLRALQLAPAGTPLYPTRWGQLAPRIGVSYRFDQSHDRSAVLRGSYGLFYDLGTGATATAAQMFPYNRTVRRTNVAYPPGDLDLWPAPLLSLDPPYTGQDFTVVDSRNTLPRTQQWSVALEQGFGRNQRVTATYTGNAGRRLLRRYFYAFDQRNPVNPAFPQARLNITRNDPGFDDGSDHQAMQLQYMRRMSRGFQALINYTLSRSTDTGSDDSFVNLEDNATSPAYYTGFSRFDRRHAFNAAMTYAIPAPRKGAAIFGGWSTDYNVRLQSAAPFTVTYSYVDPINLVPYMYRVDLVPGQSAWIDDASAPGGRRLNAAAFAIPASAYGRGVRNSVNHGDETRNGIRGFGSWNADFVLRRQWQLSSPAGRPGATAQLRAEFFNVFNNPNFSYPFSSLGTVIGATGQFNPDTRFGRVADTVGGGSSQGGLSSIYSAGAARAIQLAVRLNF